MPDRLSYLRVDFNPVADCQEPQCGWTRCCTYTTGPREVTEAAKQHARQNPGHPVFVERLSRSTYSLPAVSDAG